MWPRCAVTAWPLGILGMNKNIGDDSLRRALDAIAPAPDAKHTELQRAAQQAQLALSTQWMQVPHEDKDRCCAAGGARWGRCVGL